MGGGRRVWRFTDPLPLRELNKGTRSIFRLLLNRFDFEHHPRPGLKRERLLQHELGSVPGRPNISEHWCLPPSGFKVTSVSSADISYHGAKIASAVIVVFTE